MVKSSKIICLNKMRPVYKIETIKSFFFWGLFGPFSHQPIYDTDIKLFFYVGIRFLAGCLLFICIVENVFVLLKK